MTDGVYRLMVVAKIRAEPQSG